MVSYRRQEKNRYTTLCMWRRFGNIWLFCYIYMYSIMLLVIFYSQVNIAERGMLQQHHHHHHRRHQKKIDWTSLFSLHVSKRRLIYCFQLHLVFYELCSKSKPIKKLNRHSSTKSFVHSTEIEQRVLVYLVCLVNGVLWIALCCDNFSHNAHLKIDSNRVEACVRC